MSKLINQSKPRCSICCEMAVNVTVTECGEISDEDFEIDEFTGEVNKIILLQAVFRGALTRKWLKVARDEYEAIVRAIERHPAVLVEWKSSSLCAPSVKKRRIRKSRSLVASNAEDSCDAGLHTVQNSEPEKAIAHPTHSEGSSCSTSPRLSEHDQIKVVSNDNKVETDARVSGIAQPQSDRSDSSRKSCGSSIRDDPPVPEGCGDNDKPAHDHITEDNQSHSEVCLSEAVNNLGLTDPISLVTQPQIIDDIHVSVSMESHPRTNLEEGREETLTDEQGDENIHRHEVGGFEHHSDIKKSKGGNQVEQPTPTDSTVFGDATSVWETDKPSFSMVTTSQSASESLTVEDLPRDPDLLKEKRHHIAMELLWVQQAIHSRKQYLRLKKQMKSQG